MTAYFPQHPTLHELPLLRIIVSSRRPSIRTGLTAAEIKQAFRDNLICGMGRLEDVATKHDLYFALALTVRDQQRANRHLIQTTSMIGSSSAIDVVSLSNSLTSSNPKT